MTDPLILVLDEGTTSTRAMLFTGDGAHRSTTQQDITQHYPASGCVEHDPHELWAKTLACAQVEIARAGGAEAIACIGVANQRETVVAWDRLTSEPLANALVWQDRRTAPMCRAMREAGEEETIRAKTGLLLDPYFSATKMRWLLDNVAAVRAAADKGTLAFGTVESWLAFRLSGGAHVTDASNASRTLLLALTGASWDEGLCDAFGVPRAAMPEVIDSTGDRLLTCPSLFGRAIPIAGMAGDQQAATIGQGCLAHGQTKATFGTGAFVLANMGTTVPHSSHRLLGTVLCQLDGRRSYALEGSVFVAGSLVKWLRDSLGLIASAGESERLAASVADNGGVVVVPALSGLGAPHWRPDALASISGLSFATGRAHIARAALEAMAHQTHDLAAAFEADGAEWTSLRVDGGMVANDWIVQDLANVLDLPVTRPRFTETTALGAAMLAAVGAGMYASLKEAAARMIGATETFAPDMGEAERVRRLAQWCQALERV